MKQAIISTILIFASIGMYAQSQFTKLPRINKVITQDNAIVTIVEETVGNSGISISSGNKEGYRIKEGNLYIDGNISAIIAVTNLNQIEVNDVSVVTVTGGFAKGFEVISNDASRITINGTMDNVVLDANDASYVTLKGSANSLNVKANDASKVDGDMLAKHIFAKSYDVSNITVYGDKYVDTEINDQSKIEILKNPSSVDADSSAIDIQQMDNDDNDQDTDKISKEVEKWNKKKIKWRPNQRVWSGFEMSVAGHSNKVFQFQPDNQNNLWTIEQPSVAFHLNLFEHKFKLGTEYLKFLNGIGFQWDVLRLKNDVTLTNARDKVEMNYSQYGSDLKKNNLILGQIQVPLLLNINTKPGSKYNFHIDGGVVVGYRFKQVQKQEIAIDYKTDINQNIKSQFHQNPFDFSATVRLGIGEWSIFGMYDIASIYKKDEGPQLHGWNIGVTLVPF